MNAAGMDTSLIVEAAATLIAEQSPAAAVTMLRAAWRPDLRPREQVPFYTVWIRALCAAGEPQRALELARHARRERPRAAPLWEACGLAAMLAGAEGEAERCLAAALELGAGPSARLLLAELDVRRDRPGDALDHYEKVLADPPDDVELLVRAARGAAALRRHLGDLEGALDRLDLLLARRPWDPDALLDRAVCLSELGDDEAACAAFERAVAADPNRPWAHHDFAIALERAGRTDEARARMEHAHRLAPDEPLTCLVLGRWYAADADPERVARGFELLHAALFHLSQRASAADHDVARIVVAEAFEAFRDAGRWDEARWVLGTAADHGWLSSPLVASLAAPDDDDGGALLPFWVCVRVETDAPPDRWPDGARGYTTDLAVFARDPDEARRHALSFVHTLDGDARLSVDLEILTAEDAAESGRHLRVDPDAPCRGGVAHVLAKRTFFARRRAGP